MNKGGWIHIVEASLASIFILTVLFLFYSSTQDRNEPDFSILARDILIEISRNVTLRNAALAKDNAFLHEAVKDKIPSYLSFEIKVCEVDNVCGKSEYTEGSVYAGERIISSVVNSGQFSPKKVKLFIWREE